MLKRINKDTSICCVNVILYHGSHLLRGKASIIYQTLSRKDFRQIETLMKNWNSEVSPTRIVLYSKSKGKTEKGFSTILETSRIKLLMAENAAAKTLIPCNTTGLTDKFSDTVYYSLDSNRNLPNNKDYLNNIITRKNEFQNGVFNSLECVGLPELTDKRMNKFRLALECIYNEQDLELLESVKLIYKKRKLLWKRVVEVVDRKKMNKAK